MKDDVSAQTVLIARKQRAALEEIRALLESPSWYDGEEAMDTLLDRMGWIVEDGLAEQDKGELK